MLELDWSTLVFQFVNFAVLLVGLNFFVFRPLRRKLSERGKVIADTLQDARDQEAEAHKLRTTWEERMRQVEQQAEAIIQAAEQEAKEKSAALLRQAREHMDRLTEEMRLDLGRQRDELVAQHYDDLLDAVIALAGNVVQSVTTRRAHDDLVTNFCASIYQLPPSEVQEYRRVMAERMPSAVVITPAPLSPEQTKTLADTLSSLIDRHVELHVQVDQSLIAGLQVRLADKLIDNSVRHQLERIRERVRHDLIAQLGAASEHGRS